MTVVNATLSAGRWKMVKCTDVKKRFLRFLFWSLFTFFNVFYFVIFKKTLAK